MFSTFGPQARRAIALAEDHARALGRPAVGPEHLLLALLAVDEDGVLLRAGLRFDDVQGVLANAAPAEDDPTATAAGHLPLRIREVFRDAFRHAARLGSFEVLPLHLALALVDPVSGEIGNVMRKLGMEAEDVRIHMLAELAEARAAAQVAGDANVVALRRRERVLVLDDRFRRRPAVAPG